MGNALEFILKLTDLLTPGMRQAAKISDTEASKIGAQFDKIENKGKRMAASVNELKDRLQAVNKVRFGTTLEKEFDTATKAANKLERQIERLEGKGRSGGIGSMLGKAAVFAGLSMLGSQALGQQAQFENQSIAFKVLTGSKQSGDAMFSNIIKMADTTPYESSELARSAKTMLGYGISQKDIMPNLNMLGDLAAAQDNPADALQSLSLALGQVAAKGHLAGQEALQMINAGFNPLKEIADMTGMKMADLDKAMEKGAITIDMVKTAFQHATGPGGKFHNMMKEQSQTLGGQWSTFMDGVHHKLRSLGEFLSPVAKGLMQFGTALMAGEGPALAIAIAIGSVAAAIWGGTIATGAWTVAQTILNAVMAANPIILIIGLIIALGVWIYSLCQKYEGWGKSLQGLWQIIKGFVNYNIAAWKNFGENIWYWIQFAWLKVKGFVEWIGGAMSNVWNAIKLAAQFKFGEAKAALTAEIKTTASVELAELEKRHSAGKIKTEQEGLAALKQMRDGYNMIGLKKKTSGSVDPTTASASGTANAGKVKTDLSSFDGSDKSGKINSGGQREIKIYITKQVGAETIYVMNAEEAADKVASLSLQGMRRAMQSLNGNAASND